MPELWTDEQGEGPLAVLVHGAMDRSTSFGRMVRHLENFTVARYDRRGYGQSLELGPASTLSQHVDDLIGVIDGRPAKVFGHSMGGVIALAAAAKAPDLFDCLVAYEAPRTWEPWWPPNSAGGDALSGETDPEDIAERFMVNVIGEQRWRRLPPSTKQARRAEGHALIADLQSVRPPNPRPYADDGILCPVVAAHGTESAEVGS